MLAGMTPCRTENGAGTRVTTRWRSASSKRGTDAGALVGNWAVVGCCGSISLGMNADTHRLVRPETPVTGGTPLQGPFAPEVAQIVPALRPPLKWVGGKRWLLPHLGQIWRGHRHRRLVEPFAGGMAITFGLGPARALLNDINPHLINFYRWLLEGLSIDFPMRNSRTFYEQARARFNRLLARGAAGRDESAALFYYLNRTGYNGLCRFNRSGVFNVPFGRHEHLEYTSDFSSYQTALHRWTFLAGDFEDVAIDPEDFIYADPPYDVAFTSYSKEPFTWADQVRTAEWLSGHRGPVVLSNQATPRILELYRRLGFQMRVLTGRRSISCSGDRTPAMEVLATKNIRVANAAVDSESDLRARGES